MTPASGSARARARRPSAALVEQRHLAEHRARAEHGERLFAHAGHVAADAHLALEDDVELVARVAVLEQQRAEAGALSSVVTRAMSSSAGRREGCEAPGAKTEGTRDSGRARTS
jgi:hypothetical protein